LAWTSERIERNHGSASGERGAEGAGELTKGSRKKGDETRSSGGRDSRKEGRWEENGRKVVSGGVGEVVVGGWEGQDQKNCTAEEREDPNYWRSRMVEREDRRHRRRQRRRPLLLSFSILSGGPPIRMRLRKLIHAGMESKRRRRAHEAVEVDAKGQSVRGQESISSALSKGKNVRLGAAGALKL